MALQRLSIQNLRNITLADISPAARVNFFYGENGSGKTSVLEAISLLGLSRSFRSHKHKPLINYQADAFTIYGSVAGGSGSTIPVGVMRDRKGGSQIKLAGKSLNSSAELAAQLPLQTINSQSFLLLEGSPKVRRQFIDWLVFHVEPGFLAPWKGLQRCLKHRNSLLRRGRIESSVLLPWERELVDLTGVIDDLRGKSIEKFTLVFEQLAAEFLAVDGLSIRYYRGWDAELDYQTTVDNSRERDLRLGYTGSGAHRADLKITVNGVAAVDILSRGQQKLLVCALLVAQALVFNQLTGRRCLFLVDDLAAELDETHRCLLASWLIRMESQVFITGVYKSDLLSGWGDIAEKEQCVFHVEHGVVRSED